VTFLDAGSAIGTGALAGGVATFATTTLTVGSHSITASFPGGGSFTASVSTALVQVVSVPADSVRLRALQLAVTKVEAQASSAAFQGAVDGAISDGFSDSGGSLMTPNGGGLHFNFTAEPQPGLSGGASEFESTMSARESVSRESGLWTGQSYLAQPSTTNASNNARGNDTLGLSATPATRCRPRPLRWSRVRPRTGGSGLTCAARAGTRMSPPATLSAARSTHCSE
jgi:hypothetical protein